MTSPSKTAISDEVAGHAYRQAQRRAVVRFCGSLGINADDVLAGRVTVDLDPICGPDGKIQPERRDFI